MENLKEVELAHLEHRGCHSLDIIKRDLVYTNLAEGNKSVTLVSDTRAHDPDNLIVVFLCYEEEGLKEDGVLATQPFWLLYA